MSPSIFKLNITFPSRMRMILLPFPLYFIGYHILLYLTHNTYIVFQFPIYFSQAPLAVNPR